MKKIGFLTAMVFIVSLLGCSSVEELNPLELKAGPSDYYSYDLGIKFVTKSGDNILSHIKCAAPGDRTDFPEEYKYKRWLEVRSPNMGLEWKVDIFSKDSQNYLRPYLDAYPLDGFYSPIISDFTCEYIFGDKENHEIISEWKKVKKGVVECTKVTIDGKVYEVAYDEALKAYTITFVVD